MELFSTIDGSKLRLGQEGRGGGKERERFVMSDDGEAGGLLAADGSAQGPRQDAAGWGCRRFRAMPITISPISDLNGHLHSLERGHCLSARPNISLAK